MSECPRPWLTSKLDHADMQAAPVALLRAARQAREVLRKTGTAVVVRDGKLVEERDARPGEDSDGPDGCKGREVDVL